MNVSAKDKATGKEQSIRIESSGSLSKEDIEKMKADALAHEAEDKKAKEKAETINKGDAAIFQNEKLIEELKDKMTEDETKSVKDVIEKMREAVKNGDVDAINKTNDELTNGWQPISMRIYQNDQQAQQQQTAQQANGGNEKTTDGPTVEEADFEEVK